jgi:hypothetical protein
MIKTSELTGALLDYWTARAEGIPAEQLSIRRVPRTDNLIVVREWPGVCSALVLPFSTQWHVGGPLIEKHHLNISETDPPGWRAWSNDLDAEYGDTPLQAVCRAVVRAAFGDEVEEVAVCD